MKLPSTTQLKDRFDASNATIQKAVHLLKDEGLAVGRAGAAVTVRENRQRTVRPAASLTPAANGEAYPWLANASNRRSSVRSTLLSVEEVPVSGDVAEALGLPGGGTAVRRRQLFTIDGEPAELVASYYPLDIARGTALAEPRRIRGGTPTLLTGLGFPPRHSVDRVSARVATQEQYTALRLPGELPVLRTLRTIYGESDRPVEVTVMIKAGHLYEPRYEFTPEACPGTRHSARHPWSGTWRARCRSSALRCADRMRGPAHGGRGYCGGSSPRTDGRRPAQPGEAREAARGRAVRARRREGATPSGSGPSA